MSTAAWELVFMMVVLKLPILYLIGVVWWAVRAEPRPHAPAIAASASAPSGPAAPCPWLASRRRPRHRGPVPRPRRPAGAAR